MIFEIFSMKIAIDIRKIGKRQTGDEVYTVNLVKGLIKIDRKNSYYLCTDSVESESRVRNVLGDIPSNFKIVALSPEGKLFWTKWALPRFAKKEKIDLVHVQYITPKRLSSRIKLITTIHDVSFSRYPKYIKRKDRFILNHYIPSSIKKADKIITVSDFTRKEILDIFKQATPDKVVRVYNGIDEKRFKLKNQFDAIYQERLKNKYNLGERFIFHVSSLQPRKNIPAMIEAYREYIKKYNDDKTILVVGGEKSYNYDSSIDELMRDLTLKSKVKMIGYIKDEELPAIYSMASLYISPSLYEGFDLPLIEVMKSGVPVIASDKSCHKEIMGGAGILVDPENISEFSEKINAGLNNEALRKELIYKGLRRADEFSWDKCARETLEVYESVVSSE